MKGYLAFPFVVLASTDAGEMTAEYIEAQNEAQAVDFFLAGSGRLNGRVRPPVLVLAADSADILHKVTLCNPGVYAHTLDELFPHLEASFEEIEEER